MFSRKTEKSGLRMNGLWLACANAPWMRKIGMSVYNIHTSVKFAIYCWSLRQLLLSNPQPYSMCQTVFFLSCLMTLNLCLLLLCCVYFLYFFFRNTGWTQQNIRTRKILIYLIFLLHCIICTTPPNLHSGDGTSGFFSFLFFNRTVII